MNSPLPQERREVGRARPGSLPRWHRLYFLLAAFDVFTVCLGLYLTHQIMSSYTRSVHVTHAWVTLLQETSELGELAMAVNAPGNDIFASYIGVESESERRKLIDRETALLGKTLQRFQERFPIIEAHFRNGADGERSEPLLGELGTVRSGVLQMHGEVLEIFRTFRDVDKNKLERAGEQMARMDRTYAEVNKALSRLRAYLGMHLKEVFAAERAVASTHQNYEYGFALLILAMVAGATFYGHRLGRKVVSDSREKDDTIGLLQKVLTTQEEERRRLSRDLHDEIGQSLASVLIGLKTLEDARTLQVVADRSRELRQFIAQALDEVRRLSRGLRPSVLDDLGLAAALERHAEDYTEMHGTVVEVHLQSLDQHRLPEAIETAIFRIVQEALTNITKHAAAHKVNIAVSLEPGWVQVIVADDGRGFAIDQLLQEPAGTHLGLAGMRERAALLGGTCTINAKPGRGTRVTVRLPVRRFNDGQETRADRG